MACLLWTVSYYCFYDLLSDVMACFFKVCGETEKLSASSRAGSIRLQREKIFTIGERERERE
jgi:hypothetical protein